MVFLSPKQEKEREDAKKGKAYLPKFVLPQPFDGTMSGNSTSTQSTPLSKFSSVSISQSKLPASLFHSTTSQKTKGKQTHQDAFMDEDKAEAAVLVSITADKHAHKMAEHTGNKEAANGYRG